MSRRKSYVTIAQERAERLEFLRNKSELDLQETGEIISLLSNEIAIIDGARDDLIERMKRVEEARPELESLLKRTAERLKQILDEQYV